MVGQATILHADLDAFYASVEQLLDPSLRGKPIAVGGGVVLAASYEAKAFGVRGGMNGRRARQLCPWLQFVGGHFSEYQRLGDAVIDILLDFTPLVERISIDEAFLEVRGAQRLFGSPVQIATDIRRRVRDELGLPVSVGVASTKHLAKVASQVAKPDGLVAVEPGSEDAFLRPLPVGLLWGVGPVNEARLAARGIHTIGDLAATPSSALTHLLGNAVGSKLGSPAHNRDERAIETLARARSIGAQSAFGRKVATPELIGRVLGYLADRVGTRMRAKRRAGRTISVRVRFPGLQSVTRAITLPAPVATTRTITEVAQALVASALTDHPDETEISLLAISVSHLVEQPDLQLEMPFVPIPGGPEARRRPGTPQGAARWAVDHAVDRVRARFGRSAVGFATVQLSDMGGVPDEFRELAQHEG